MKSEDISFYRKKKSINCKDKLFIFEKPVVMGILNLTPDSFFKGSRVQDLNKAIEVTAQMLEEGAEFIDIGGHSSRPGADIIPLETELDRTIPVVKALEKEFKGIKISIDTYRSCVAEAAIDSGAVMVNDISGGEDDPYMIDTIARLKVPYIIMHKKGSIQNMQENPVYQDVFLEICGFFAKKLEICKLKGIHDVIIDPGFGFGKSLQNNYELLKKLELFKIFEVPLLAGLSRKSMINKVLDIQAGDALNGTSVLNTLALLKGADILRVHDVKQAVETVKLINYYDSV